MSKLLKEVISKISKMPEDDQNSIAQLLLEELSWENAFAQSQEQLQNLAQEAIREWESGKTKPFNLK